MNDSEENNKSEYEMEVDLSDSESNDDEELKLELRVSDLESIISKDAFAYDSYVELVGIYKKLFNLTKMRETYEKFRKKFPLTDKLWLDWIKSEISIISTDEEKKFVVSLFDEAVKDYLSVDLWLEYVQFSIGLNDADFTKKVFERAINACGLHFLKGSLIWDAYREYELALLSIISEIGSDAWKKKVNEVNEIFRRQLSIPLMDMERTFVEWRVWVERLPNNEIIDKEPVNWAYKKATKYLNDYMDFENKLQQAQIDAEKLEVYRKYIDFEEKIENIRCLYERVVAELSLNPEIWIDYTMYYYKLENYSSSVETCQRGIRNCPWIPDLWILAIRVMEIAGKTHQEITECFEQSLMFVQHFHLLQLWLTYLEYFRRISDPNDPKQVEKLRKAFEKGEKHLEDFGIKADPERLFLRFWAKVEVSFLKDITAARKIWNEYMLNNDIRTYANTWLEIINLEQQFGDPKHVRKTYQRALNTVKDWPQTIIQSWSSYERLCGTVDSTIICTETCRKYMKEYTESRLQETHEENIESEVPEREDKNQKSLKHLKRELKHKLEKNNAENEKKIKQVKITDKSPSKEIIIEQEKSPSSKEFNKIELDSSKEKRSVFISNLDYSVTEEQLKEFIGPLEELRLITDRKGISKGYAYCVLLTEGEAKQMLKRDRELLNSRPVFISECNADKMKRKVQFRYSLTQEKNKLFVKGLPLTLTQEKLEELFKQYGTLKEARLVTYRNGKSKGLAYVEFQNEQDAAKALIATDNTVIDGYTISVAISNPPQRKTELPAQEGRHSKSRIQVPLIPRAIVTPSQPCNSKRSKPITTQSSMTNDDFRKLFNK